MRPARGFTLVEVLVALVVVALGLTALMVAVSSTARTSGFLRDKAIAQWIALNRIAEVRLNLNKFGQNTDTGELDFAGRKWHYDTRYFDTSVASMKRVVVRVYLGDSKTKGNAIIESTSFTGSQLSIAGSSNNIDWTSGGSVPLSAAAGASATSQSTTTNSSTTTTGTGTTGTGTTTIGPTTTPTPTPTP